MEEGTAAAVNAHQVVDADTGKPTPLLFYSVRCLSKAMTGYGPVGCTTDVVNLLFAMKGDPPHPEPDDGETDDLVCWLLLERAHRAQGTRLGD
eukprot:gene5565-11631_t